MGQTKTITTRRTSRLAAMAVFTAVAIIAGCTTAPTNTNVATNQPVTRPTPEASVQPSPETTPPASPTETPSVSPAAAKTFTIIGKNFSFSETKLRVKVGDRVKIIFKNEDGFHDWVIDEFSARTPQIQTGTQAEVEFVASIAGTFEYYCSVGEHRAKGMKGNLIVE